jgi:hypothetical protein
MAIVAITIKVYIANIIPATFWIVIDNIGRFLLSPRKIKEKNNAYCLGRFRQSSLASEPFLLSGF